MEAADGGNAQDRHAQVRQALGAGGLSQEAAEAIVEGLSEADLSELATKSDIDELKTAVSELKVAISDLRADIYGRLWIMGLGIVGLTVALIKVLPA